MRNEDIFNYIDNYLKSIRVMKQYLTILILAIGLFSCSNEVLPLTPDLVTEIHA